MRTHKQWRDGKMIHFEIDGIEQPITDEAPPEPRDLSPVAVEKRRIELRRDRWPVVLLPMKALAASSDRGAGDVIARVIGPIGGEAFKKWYKLMFGKSCGCGNRQEALNRRWPI